MKTYVQNSEANLGQTLRASLGLLILTLVGCGAAYSAIATGAGQVLFNNQANALYKMKKYKESIRSCSNSLRIDSKNTYALNLKVELYILLEKYKQAINDIDIIKQDNQDISI
jgi:tetratricopeptide (TPR) repeat protein